MKKLELNGLEDDKLIVKLFDDDAIEITAIDVDGDKSGEIFLYRTEWEQIVTYLISTKLNSEA